MTLIPPEVKALVIAEIWNSENHNDGLSALSLVWPDAIPLIREYRFRALRIVIPDRSKSLLALIAGSPEVASAIRVLTISSQFIEIGHVIRVISTTVNLENLELIAFNTGSDLELLPILTLCQSLTTIWLVNLTASTVSDLLHILHSLPHLTSLNLSVLNIEELNRIASTTFPNAEMPLELNYEVCAPWNTAAYAYEAEPVAHISYLRLELYGSSDLLLYDIISSQKTPFPNLQEIVLIDSGVKSHRSLRLSTLLGRYKTSLRTLDLESGVDENSAKLMLPATVEHFKFGVGFTSSVDSFCYALSSLPDSENLKSVTVRLHSVDLGIPDDIERLDEVLAGMECLNRLNVEVDFYRERCEGLAKINFPRCVRRFETGELSGGIYEEVWNREKTEPSAWGV